MVEKITKDMNFAELLGKYPETVEVLFDKGMHCIGCPMSQSESLEDGIKSHGLKVNEVLKELNEKIKEKKK